MYDRVLIPVDGSDEAAFAAKRGLELARVFDATVDVIHVVEQTSLRLTRTSGEGHGFESAVRRSSRRSPRNTDSRS